MPSRGSTHTADASRRLGFTCGDWNMTSPSPFPTERWSQNGVAEAPLAGGIHRSTCGMPRLPRITVPEFLAAERQVGALHCKT
jgi:hypothetical protein